jgi:hypothetical protein
VPIWYNLSMKIYVPGFIAIPPEKNLTFDAALIIKFRVEKNVKRIELNSLKLDLPEAQKFEILQDSTSKQVRKRETNETLLLNQTSIGDDQPLIPVETAMPVNEEQPDEANTDLVPTNRMPANIHVTSLVQNETLEKVILELDGELQSGQDYYLKFAYSGPIDTKLSGLYLTQYSSAEGKQRYAAVTQMEPTDARRMVPCFDEPAMKAVWRLRVIHPAGSKAVGNAIEIKEDEPTNDPDWLLTTFEETLPMSSYLLALVVSDFEYVEGHTKRNTRFRIWARKDALNETDYALAAGIKVLEFYEDYYGIPFPLPKQDMMAFPDFGAGAMENWGLVT